MKKNIIIPLLLGVTIFLSGCFALAEPEESSGTVAAPTLAAVEQAQEAPAAQEEQSEEAPTAVLQPEAEEPVVEETYPAAEPYPPPEPTAAPDTIEAYPAGETVSAPEHSEPPGDYPAGSAGGEAVQGSAVYEIDPARSEARFSINEVLRGTPKTVVGVSGNLGGQIALDLNDPAAAQVGTILINARDFTTDNDFRNNAIANKILLSNDFEFITFEPTSITGLPDSAVIGETYPLQLTGNLTILDQTREVTFDVQVTPLSETELGGLAMLEILYADFGLSIPFAQSVDSVEDNVLLELEFIAAQ